MPRGEQPRGWGHTEAWGPGGSGSARSLLQPSEGPVCLFSGARGRSVTHVQKRKTFCTGCFYEFIQAVFFLGVS